MTYQAVCHPADSSRLEADASKVYQKFLDFIDTTTLKYPSIKPLTDKLTQYRNYDLFISILETIPEIHAIKNTDDEGKATALASRLVDDMLLQFKLNRSDYDESDITKLVIYLQVFATY